MKKQLLMALIAALFFINCSKKNNNTASPAPTPVNEYFRGKLDGIVFTDPGTAKILPATATPANELHITGYHSNGAANLTLRSYTGTTGERLLDANNYIAIFNGGFFYAGSIVAGTPVQGSGKINILEITSSYIKGTFECIAPSDPGSAILPTQFMTEGEFKLKRL